MSIMSSLAQMVEGAGGLPEDIILISAEPKDPEQVASYLSKINEAFDNKPPSMIVFDESWSQTCEEDTRPVRYLLQDSLGLTDDQLDKILND